MLLQMPRLCPSGCTRHNKQAGSALGIGVGAGSALGMTVGVGSALGMTIGAKLAIMSQRVTKIDIKTDNLTYFFATKAMAQDWIIPSRPHKGQTKR